MCELFALSASRPTRVNLSLEELASHSDAPGSNHDGWGTVLYEGRGARLVKEAAPASGSAILRFMQEHELRSTLVLSHIRHATRGGLDYTNTHPFCRELGGRVHAFAHNGTLAEPARLLGARPRFRPIGQTDSEEAFCVLLARLEDLWLDCDAPPPPVAARLAVVAETAADLRRMGEANFLYADSDVLFVHGHIRRSGPGEPAQWPGLRVTMRALGMDDGDREVTAGVSVQSDEIVPDVVLVASVPLTAEPWTPVPEGDVLAIRRGKIVARAAAN